MHCISALMDIAKIANLAYSLDSGKITCKLPNSKQLNETQLLLSQVIFAQFYLGLEQIACSEQAKNGDYIEIKGLNGKKKIKDIFIDKKIPITLRDKYPLLVDDNDSILWIPNIKKSKFNRVS